MPYRRLPKTDAARLRALQTVIKRAEADGFNRQVVSYASVNEARAFLVIFQKKMQQYQQVYDNRVSASKDYRHIAAKARMYVSHFIQVYTLAVIRGEIKADTRAFYHLPIDNFNLPDMTTDDQLMEWGKNIIEGETDRIRHGGQPIYNPTIAKVQVHYDIFKEKYTTQKFFKNNASRNWSELDALRAEADTLLLDIWNQVENFFALERPYARMTHCQEYGLVYYYRRHEAPLTPESDKQLDDLENAQASFNFNV